MVKWDCIGSTNYRVYAFIHKAFDYLIQEIKKNIENKIKSQMCHIDATQEQIDKAMGIIYTFDGCSCFVEYLKWQERKPKKWKIIRRY